MGLDEDRGIRGVARDGVHAALAQALDDLAVLRRLIAGVSGAPSVAAAEVDSVWSELAAQVPALAGLTWSTIPATGAPIDGSAWAAQPYVEGESLHFKPAAKTAHA